MWRLTWIYVIFVYMWGLTGIYMCFIPGLREVWQLGVWKTDPTDVWSAEHDVHILQLLCVLLPPPPACREKEEEGGEAERTLIKDPQPGQKGGG